MLRYIFKRLLMLIPIIIGASAIIFFILNLGGDDPVMLLLAGTEPDELTIELTRKELGLDKPIAIQFLDYMKGLLTGDLGTSWKTGKPVFEEYMMRFPATVKLAFVALSISVLISIPIGIISAVKQYSLFDNIGMVAALLGIAMPNFWLGLLLIICFSVQLGWLPSGGYGGLAFLILPAITIGTDQAALLTRMTRSSMLEVIRQDYIRTARAKGLVEKVIIIKHGLKNALIPIVTVIGNQFGHALGGAVLTETIFSWPGVGRFMIEGINKHDRPVVIGCVIMLCIMISIVNLGVDIIYAFVDPRIKTDMTKKVLRGGGLKCQKGQQ
ncbi:MAG TPA: ABC transporter permease [Bacillota bacterium]|nr:ABC transporter permease [Bacillota bacterium]HQE67501.1 ABC transporter permease [Bacillota bacterium]HQI16443.1 ABC transporter permease [Bacillota bacterium]HQJ36931.1 ABC transporter permease [Bacillota bacterium]HRU41498.1 ABC transporter permease [Candidatus Diapherotrites archaeon]